MGRVLGATRLSHDTDASTSIERQREAIEGWSRAQGHQVVAITEDADVSGSIAPQERDGLGPWLSSRKVGQWDVLVVAKLDRVSRSLMDFASLLEWCQANGKALVSVAEGLDFGTPTGQFIGKILVLFAEWERQTMRERRADAARKLINRGGYNGGSSMPWGYRAVNRGGQLEIEPDPDRVPEITEIVNEVLSEKAVTAVARARGINPTTLLRRLRSPVLKGFVTYMDEVVRGDDGLPLLREPIIPAATWSRLQAKLDANSAGAGVPHNANPWLHTIYCDVCKAPMYLTKTRNSQGRPYRYYRHECGDCRIRVNGDSLEPQIHGLVMRVFDGLYVPEIIEVPAEDHTAELAKLDEAVAAWEARAVGGDAAESVMRILDGLHAKRKALLSQPLKTEAWRKIRETAELLTERWLSLETDHERGALLRSMSIRIMARKAGPAQTKIRLQQGGKHWADVAREWTDADVEQFETESETA
jgi:site-specific DNA recombinase